MCGLSVLDVLNKAELRKMKLKPPKAPRRRKSQEAAQGAAGPATAASGQMLLCSIDVLEECIVLTRYEKGGASVRKIVDPSDVGKLFADLSGGPKGRRVELRPDGRTLAAWIGADGVQRYVVLRPGHRRMIRVKMGKKRVRLSVRLPDLVARMAGSMKDGRFAWTSIEQVGSFHGRGRPRGRDLLHTAPLPNCDIAGGVCMGSIRLNRRDWAELGPGEVFEKAFLETDFADHWLAEPLTDKAQKVHRNLLAMYRRSGGRLVAAGDLRSLGTLAAFCKQEGLR